ncbi:MAG TPA: cellulose synthase [Streptosporangiales bacterium]
MNDYGQVLWLPVAAGLSGVGLLISIVLWRRRGAASGLRAASWSLLPIGLYLVGLLGVLVPFGFRLASWAAHLVFSLSAWLGLAVIGLAVLLWIVSGVMLGRRRARADAEDGDTAVGPGRDSATKQVTTGRSSGKAKASDEDEFSDIEEILKRRGIS